MEATDKNSKPQASIVHKATTDRVQDLLTPLEAPKKWSMKITTKALDPNRSVTWLQPKKLSRRDVGIQVEMDRHSEGDMGSSASWPHVARTDRIYKKRMVQDPLTHSKHPTGLSIKVTAKDYHCIKSDFWVHIKETKRSSRSTLKPPKHERLHVKRNGNRGQKVEPAAAKNAGTSQKPNQDPPAPSENPTASSVTFTTEETEGTAAEERTPDIPPSNETNNVLKETETLHKRSEKMKWREVDTKLKLLGLRQNVTKRSLEPQPPFCGALHLPRKDPKAIPGKKHWTPLPTRQYSSEARGHMDRVEARKWRRLKKKLLEKDYTEQMEYGVDLRRLVCKNEMKKALVRDAALRRRNRQTTRFLFPKYLRVEADKAL